MAELDLPGATRCLRVDPGPRGGDCALEAIELRPLPVDGRRHAQPVRALGANVAARRWLRRVRLGLGVLLRSGPRALMREARNSLRADSLSPPGNYAEWIARNEPPASLHEGLRADQATWPRRPSLSVIMPVFNAPAAHLRAAVGSVLGQLYPHWELCIADDASTHRHVRAMLDDFARRDGRIRLRFRERNGHVCAASNSALELATGEYVAFLDQDDVLHPLALHHLAECLAARPEVELAFSDEDKLDAGGARFDPHFKCELNPELLLAQNMVCHLAIYRTATVRELGGLREGFEGAQDYDLALRVVDQHGANKVAHVPKVLYHWRQAPGSTALSRHEKPYAAAAGRRAVSEHLRRTGRRGEVVDAPEAPGMNRVVFALPRELPRVSVIVLTRDNTPLLERCIDSLLGRSTYPAMELIVVDNGSRDPEALQFLEELPVDRCRVLRDASPFNFSALNNRAARHASGEFLCLLNDDVEVLTPGWLEEMVRFGSPEGTGCVGARLWYPDGRLQHGGIILGIGGVAGHAHKNLPRGRQGYFSRAVLHQRVSAVTGACMLVRRALYQALGGLDEGFPVAFNDVDFCLRVRERGFANIWTPYAELLHHESASRGTDDTPERRALFDAAALRLRDRWGEALSQDPWYSVNLTLQREDFGLR